MDGLRQIRFDLFRIMRILIRGDLTSGDEVGSKFVGESIPTFWPLIPSGPIFLDSNLREPSLCGHLAYLETHPCDGAWSHSVQKYGSALRDTRDEESRQRMVDSSSFLISPRTECTPGKLDSKGPAKKPRSNATVRFAKEVSFPDNRMGSFSKKTRFSGVWAW